MTARFYIFDAFVIDAARRLLSLHGEPVHLSSKPFDLLLYLVKHSGEVVTKDELVSEVWASETITDANLAQHIATVRRALRDTSDVPRLLLTHYRRGYQLTATVEEREHLPSHAAGVPESPSERAFHAFCEAHMYLQYRTAASLHAATVLFASACEEDPTFVEAFAGLARAHMLLGEHLREPPERAFPKGRDAALRALELDITCSAAHSALAQYFEFYEHDWNAALSEHEMALAMNPSLPSAVHALAWHYVLAGQFDRAYPIFHKALGFELASTAIMANLANAYYLGGQFEKGLLIVARILQSTPNLAYGRYVHALLLNGSGRHDEAIDTLGSSAESDVNSMAVAINAHARSGALGTAKAMLSELLELGKTRYVSGYLVAFAHAGFGDEAAAVAALRAAIAERCAWLPFALVDPGFAFLRDNVVFDEISANVFRPAS